MLSRTIINTAYNTRGNELCKFVRAEVMEQIEEHDLTTTLTEEEYDTIVKNVMDKIKAIIVPVIEIELG